MASALEALEKEFNVHHYWEADDKDAFLAAHSTTRFVGATGNAKLDAAMMDHELLNYHPLENTATTTIRSADLVVFIRSCGHEPRIVAVG